MATWKTVCDIVKALPGTELDAPTRVNPAWRVDGKVIVRRNPRLRIVGEDGIRRCRGELVAIWTDRDERQALLQEDPDTFFMTPHWESYPYVLVWPATVQTDQLQELLIAAWRARAPKRLLRELEGE